MAKIRAVRNQELDSLEVALRGSDSNGCSSIIIVGVDLPPLNLKNGHVFYVIFERSVEKTVVIIPQSLKFNRLIGLLFARFSTL